MSETKTTTKAKYNWWQNSSCQVWHTCIICDTMVLKSRLSLCFVHCLQELDEAEIEEARRRRQQLENDDSEMYETLVTCTWLSCLMVSLTKSG